MRNLVTGVFVEGAQRIAREEKNQALTQRCAVDSKEIGSNLSGEYTESSCLSSFPGFLEMASHFGVAVLNSLCPLGPRQLEDT